MIIIMMRLLLLLLLAAAVAAKMMILAACFALLEGRRSSGGLLTKATNHGGLDKSCHPATITQSENDSTTSTRLHKSNASKTALKMRVATLGCAAAAAKKIKWSNTGCFGLPAVLCIHTLKLENSSFGLKEFLCHGN